MTSASNGENCNDAPALGTTAAASGTLTGAITHDTPNTAVAVCRNRSGLPNNRNTNQIHPSVIPPDTRASSGSDSRTGRNCNASSTCKTACNAKIAPNKRGEVGRSAYVFGPERSGLETEDVAIARAIVTVPINPEFGSLNLAQAVILLAYEWSKNADLAQPPMEDLLPPAPQEELEGLIQQMESVLEPTGYFHPEGRAAATRLTLRNMLTKPGWNHLEVRTMRGVLSSLGRGPRKDS